MGDSAGSSSQRISRGFISAAQPLYKNPCLWVATVLAILTVVAVGVHAHQQAATTPQPAHHFSAHHTLRATQSGHSVSSSVLVAVLFIGLFLLMLFGTASRR